MPSGIYQRKTGIKIRKQCQYCGKEFWGEKWYINKRRFCSLQCYWKSLKGRKLPRKQVEKIRNKNTGKKRSKEFCEKLRGNTRGFRKGHKLTPIGKNHYLWKGGITPENKKIRKSSEYKDWRGKVFKYDNYTCWICEYKGKELYPHHLKSFSKYPELRFEISNGLTLCKFCHKTYTDFGNKMKCRIQK